MCDNNSCLLKFISISPQGDLYFCSRLSYKEFCLGNIHDYDNIEDAFLSKNAMEFTKQSIIRRNTCMSTCDLFHICNGGCNANSYTTDGVEKINPMYCKYIRKAYEMSQSVMENDT